MALDRFESWARRTNRLHLECWAVLAPFFTSEPYSMDISDIYVLVQDRPLTIGLRGGAMVLGNTIRVRSGILDANTYLYHNLWSWTQPKGVANWAHEVFHIHQWRRDRWRYYWRIATGMLGSWSHGDVYDHQRIGPELEAIAFEKYVEAELWKRKA